jgi:2-polyprenyl-3-methyl-5-hydroxy-6-metoxy-1,4-benzoquinol methylase
MKSLSHCPICQSQNIAYSFTGVTNRNPAEGKEWVVFQCGDCNHAFMNPQPDWSDLQPYYSESYDAYDPNHGSSSDSEQETISLAQRQGEWRHVQLPIEGKRVLDVGCGGGYFLRIARQLGAITQGVEPSDAGSALTRQQGLAVFQGMLTDYLASNTCTQDFDIITSSHVVEHVPSPVETLREMKSILATSSYIWLAVPNAQCYFSRELGKNWHSRDLPYHLHQFSLQSLAKAGELAGLHLRRQYTYSLPTATAASLTQYLRKKYFLPQRLTRKIGPLNTTIAGKLAHKLDTLNDGEAIIAEFEVKN